MSTLHRRLINSINDDSDEDPEESLEEIMVIFGLNKSRKSIKYLHRRLNWEEHVRKLLHTKQFASRYHMTLPTFNKLVDHLRPMVTVNEAKSRNSTSNNEPIYPEMIVGAGLRFLGGSYYKDIEDIYGISNRSARRIIDLFVTAVKTCDALAIRLPRTPGELEVTANGFAQCSSANGVYYGCVGCLDGWLPCITKPKNHAGVRPADYFSGHYSRFGLNIQAMCDSKLRFTYFCVAAAGKTNDNRAFGRCLDLIEWLQSLPDGYFVIGDNAYTISNNLIIPFTASQLAVSEYRRTYNYFLSQLRIRIEMAFGRLTTKWRIFRRNLDGELHRVSALAMAAARLHNFIIDNDQIQFNVGHNNDFMDPSQWGVETLGNIPEAPNNNGYLGDQHVVDNNFPSSRRDVILNAIIERDLCRPAHNIARNAL